MSDRLIVVSNRLPIAIENADGDISVKHGSGGLVTALGPVLHRESGIWIGWPGAERSMQVERALSEAAGDYELRPVFLTDEEIQKFYLGFSNEVLWPLFHDFTSLCRFDPEYWDSYTEVNRKYAEAVAREVRGPGDFIWVQDYQLLLAGQYLRELGVEQQVAFFLHIPFPPLDIYGKMPWRAEALQALVHYDVIGLQTARDRRNLAGCLRHLTEASLHAVDDLLEVEAFERKCRVGAFPISIDFAEFSSAAARDEVTQLTQELKQTLAPAQIVVGIDRLDYTKGMPERVKAFGALLEHYPELHKKVVLIQVAIPSREDIQEYQDLKLEIERLVSAVNGRFTEPGWVPIQYMNRSLSRTELLAYYRAADVGLVTPLKDGMNLVAKEYCAAQVEENGVLVLSEFAGAALQLKSGALLVNPYDIRGTARAIHQALTMPKAQRRRRMKRLRASIQKQDIHRWAQDFFSVARSQAQPDRSHLELPLAS